MRQTISALRLVAIVGLFLMIQTGCMPAIDKLTQPVNHVESQVFLQPAFIAPHQGKLVIYPFTHPHYAPGTGTAVTHEFYQELLRSGLYRQIVLSKQMSNEPAGTLISPELQDFNLAMRGRIVHVLAGSGNTPTQLTVEIQIMNVFDGAMIWFVRLEATSETGADIDLVWHTFPGQGTHSYQALARALAQQLVRLMTPPPENETPVVPKKSPVATGPMHSRN